MRTTKVVWLISGILLAVLLVTALQPTQAQTPACPGTASWEVRTGRFGEQSFYAVKFNRCTGETAVLTATRGAKDDKWLVLPTEEVQNRK